MLNRLLAVSSLLVLLNVAASNVASADEETDETIGAIAGAILFYEHRETPSEHLVREERPSFLFEEEDEAHAFVDILANTKSH